jgi:hypothetical protein
MSSLLLQAGATPPRKPQAPSISFFRDLLDGNSWLRKTSSRILRLKITRDNAARFEQPGLVSESVPEMRFSNVRMAVFEAHANIRKSAFFSDERLKLVRRKRAAVAQTDDP